MHRHGYLSGLGGWPRFVLLCVFLLIPLASTAQVEIRPLEEAGLELDLDPDLEKDLVNNPFSRPAKVVTPKVVGSQDSPREDITLQLHGTLIAGEQSLADIGGEIFALGDEVNGQRLVEVHGRYIVLAADARRITLWVNGESSDE